MSISSTAERTSRSVMATWVIPLSDAAHLTAGRSSHPTLLLRPVVVPYSRPTLPVVQRHPEQRTCVSDHRPDKFREGEQPGGDIGHLVVLLAVDVLEDRVLFPQSSLELGLQDAFVEDILDTNAVASDLILVGRAYTTVRRPYSGVAQCDLAVRVERDVVGHDQMRPTVYL